MDRRAIASAAATRRGQRPWHVALGQMDEGASGWDGGQMVAWVGLESWSLWVETRRLLIAPPLRRIKSMRVGTRICNGGFGLK